MGFRDFYVFGEIDIFEPSMEKILQVFAIPIMDLVYNCVKNKLLPRIRIFREITFFMLWITRITKIILNA
jgi:hypothetical protein